MGEIQVGAAKCRVSGFGEAAGSPRNHPLASEDTFTPPTKPSFTFFLVSCSQPPSPLVFLTPAKIFFSGNTKPQALTAEDKRISKKESGKERDVLLSSPFYKDEVPSAGADISSTTG